ncbi:MAG TPA: hemerythrin domain-containing protein [Candidatus Thermoplasmatota archaeon]|nr:hemerythrin domain-containing protein [Candidatus Thermoplasmatota archaeon]
MPARSAIEILKHDHKEAKGLFEKILTTDDDAECERLYEELARELRIHVAVEKDVFYPRILEELGDKIPQDIIDHQEKEESESPEMLDQLDTIEDDDEWMETFREFRDTVLEHAVAVEEGKLFPLVERSMSREDLQELGREMEERKNELKSEYERPAER